MTQEAKQAAQEHAYNPYSYSGEMFCEGYDAARAPLVAALRRMPELAYEVIHERDSSITVENLPMELQCICDAALTGTGKK